MLQNEFCNIDFKMILVAHGCIYSLQSYCSKSMIIFSFRNRRIPSSFSLAALCGFYLYHTHSCRVWGNISLQTVSVRVSSQILRAAALQPERLPAALQVTPQGINAGVASCTFYVHFQFQTTLIVVYLKLLQTLTSCFQYLLCLVWRLAMNWRISEDMSTFIELRASGLSRAWEITRISSMTAAQWHSPSIVVKFINGCMVDIAGVMRLVWRTFFGVFPYGSLFYSSVLVFGWFLSQWLMK